MAYRWHGQPWPTEQNPRRAKERVAQEPTHCRNGHELTDETTRLQSNGARVARVCLVCEYERSLRQKQAQRERRQRETAAP